MPTFRSKSAIQKAREQLFVDFAEGLRLNIVSSNLGLDRPRAGVTDDKWRALVRKIALQPKLVIPIFHRILEIALGPRTTRVNTLSQNAPAGETSLFLESADDFIQVGTLTLDPGLATEEEIDFRFRSKRDKRIYLSAETQFAHNAVAHGSGRLVAAVSATATSLILDDSTDLPTTGFPYSLVVGKGTENEEFVSVSANDTGTGTLTTSALANSHVGPKSLYISRELDAAAPAGRLFVKLNSTAGMPNTGYIRLDFGAAEEEVAEYTDNQYTDSVLILKRPLGFAHADETIVDLVSPGTFVETASVVQTGVDWEVRNTETGVVKIVIPEGTYTVSMRDASRLHGTYTAANTTLAANVLTTDTELVVDDASGFPDSGEVLVDGTGALTYVGRVTLPSEVTSEEGPFALTDGQTLTFEVDGSGTETATFNTGDFVDITAAQPDEVANVINADTSDCTAFLDGDSIVIRSDSGGTVKVTGGAANAVLGFPETVEKLTLLEAAGAAFTSGDTVVLVQAVHAGTDLPDGNFRDASGDIIDDGFPGPYLYDPTQTAIRSTVTTLASGIRPALEVAYAQEAGRTCLEVIGGDFWPTYGDFEVEIGRNTGFSETQNFNSITTKITVSGEVATNASAGVFELEVTNLSGEFPESSSAFVPAGYRVTVNRNGGNEETLYVDQVDTSTVPDTMSFLTATISGHTSGEPIELIYDVLTVGTLTERHAAGHLVEAYVDEIELADATGFTAAGDDVYINFGKGMLNYRGKITALPALDEITLSDTSKLPTSGFPYRIVVSQGMPKEEVAQVTANNTGSNTLTLSADLKLSHAVGDYVEFTSGDPEVVSYSSVDGNVLTIDPPAILESEHLEGETVHLVAGDSVPDTEGHDFAFYLPPDFNSYIEEITDLVRAAGVSVEFLEK